jgi:ABC-type enterochelin transport system substrate-binding protein
LKNLPSIRERVLNVNHGAHDLLKELGRSQNAKPAPKVVNFLRQVEELTKDLLLTPLTDWQHELEALRKDLK